MAFRLGPQQHPSDSVLACIDAEVDAAIESLSVADPAETEELHEWRKRAKDLWYHHRLIKDTPTRGWPARSRRTPHELSDLLDDDHDLAVLRATIIDGEPPAATAPVDLEPIVDLIDERRAELQEQARRVARRLYADKPKAFSHRMRAVLGVFADDGREAAPAGSGPVAA